MTLEPRTTDIRIVEASEQVLNQQRFNVSQVGDFKAVVGLTSDVELFVEIYQKVSGVSGTSTIPHVGNWRVFRIMFDHITTQKMRIVLRRTE